jgi:hypothetical protein
MYFGETKVMCMAVREQDQHISSLRSVPIAMIENLQQKLSIVRIREIEGFPFCDIL